MRKDSIVSIIRDVKKYADDHKDDFPDDKIIVHTFVTAASKSPFVVPFDGIPEKYQDDPDIVLASNRIEWASSRLRDDGDFVMKMFDRHPYEFDEFKINHVSDRLKGDRKFMTEAIILLGGLVIRYASDELRACPDMVLLAIQNYKPSSKYAPGYLRTVQNPDGSVTIKSCRGYGALPPEHANNRQLVLEMAKRFGSAIFYVNPCFLDDREIVLEAFNSKHRNDILSDIRSTGNINYNQISPCLRNPFRNDLEVMKAIATILGAAGLPPAIENREVAKALLKSDPLDYKSISEELRDDEELLCIALHNAENDCVSHIFQSASQRLRSNRTIVMAVVRLDACALSSCSDDMLQDRELILEAIKSPTFKHTWKNNVLSRCSADILQDPEIILEAIRNATFAEDFFAEEALDAVQILMPKEYALAYATSHVNPDLMSQEIIVDDQEIVEAYLTNPATTHVDLNITSQRLQNKDQIIHLIMDIDPRLYTACSVSQQQTRSIVMATLTSKYLLRNPMRKYTYQQIFARIKEVSSSFLDDEEIIDRALDIDGRYLRFASERLHGNRDICLKAVQNESEDEFMYLGGHAIEAISPSLIRKSPEVLIVAISELMNRQVTLPSIDLSSMNEVSDVEFAFAIERVLDLKWYKDLDHLCRFERDQILLDAIDVIRPDYPKKILDMFTRNWIDDMVHDIKWIEKHQRVVSFPSVDSGSMLGCIFRDLMEQNC